MVLTIIFHSDLHFLMITDPVSQHSDLYKTWLMVKFVIHGSQVLYINV